MSKNVFLFQKIKEYYYNKICFIKVIIEMAILIQ